MTTQPSFRPPAVADRRAPDRRSSPPRRPERDEALRTAAAAAIAVCGGLAMLFAFFAAIGTINVGDAYVSVLIACGLAAVWIGGVLWARRFGSGPSKADRERRGF
jgi:hypothetical protein